MHGRPLVCERAHVRVCGLRERELALFCFVCRLIHDRELALYDGTRLLQAERYDEIKRKNNFSDEAMLER